VKQVLTEIVYPRGGWRRAIGYVKLRLRRLPDTPEKIARGIFAGVVTAFTPFYGLHFVAAFILAKLVRGNVIAALLSSFVGNPLTYVPIAVLSTKIGQILLGNPVREGVDPSMGHKFSGAGHDLWHNFTALFTSEKMDWRGLHLFYDDLFLPFLIGGLIPGVVLGLVSYYLSVPVIRAYQNHRRKLVRQKLSQLGRVAANPADGAGHSG
jgi:uncharacterized protein (DUF2062 family)